VIGRRRRLADAAALVPDVLAALPGPARGWTIDDACVTSTDMAVIVLVARAPAAVVKLPLTAAAARGLERESLALTALHADARLGEWRALLPRMLARGSVRGQPYRLDAALPGRPPAATAPCLEAAAEVIHELHRATACEVSGDAVAERWIDAPLRELARHARPARRPVVRIGRLREELYRALDGRRLTAGWIHGDYWLGNVLCPDGRARPAGIADWEAAGTPEPALHDVLHLLLTGRRLAGGEQLGAIVRGHLRGAGWSPRERQLLRRYAAWGDDGALSERHALLLYWLRQAAVHARQQSRAGGGRYRWWEVRNVDAVLTAL
jgi:aminoglycoside phosphotransferase (APT) family kinase protein